MGSWLILSPKASGFLKQITLPSPDIQSFYQVPGLERAHHTGELSLGEMTQAGRAPNTRLLGSLFFSTNGVGFGGKWGISASTSLLKSGSLPRKITGGSLKEVYIFSTEAPGPYLDSNWFCLDSPKARRERVPRLS